LIKTALTLLTAAVAVYFAVKLVESVERTLVCIGLAVALIYVGWIIQRRRSSGW
jgi:uncharacterized membrane protein